MHGISLSCDNKHSTVGVLVKGDRFDSIRQNFSTFLKADLTKLAAGVFPVDGCAIKPE